MHRFRMKADLDIVIEIDDEISLGTAVRTLRGIVANFDDWEII